MPAFELYLNRYNVILLNVESKQTVADIKRHQDFVYNKLRKTGVLLFIRYKSVLYKSCTTRNKTEEKQSGNTIKDSYCHFLLAPFTLTFWAYF